MISLLIETTPNFVNLGILLLHLFIGVCFIVHGLGKLGLVGPGNMAGFTGWLQSLGLPFPALQARLAMLFEIVGGTLIVLGLFTRVGCLMCLATMLVATFLGHRGGGYLVTNNPPGNEYPLNLAVICIVMILLGPGAFSLDAYLFASP